MSLFKQVTNENLEPIDEGWGTFAFHILAQVNPFPISMVTNKIPFLISKTNMKRILKNDLLQKYLKKECDELYKQERKTDSTVTHIFPPGLLHTLRETIYTQYQAGNALDQGKYWNQSTLTNEFLEGVFNGYTVVVFFDMEHIQSIRVIFYSKKRDVYYDRFITSPRSMKQIGFYKEKIL